MLSFATASLAPANQAVFIAPDRSVTRSWPENHCGWLSVMPVAEKNSTTAKLIIEP